jgi:hypothetical protein
MDNPVLEGRRVVKGGMFPHQRDWWSLPNRIKLLVCGYGAGKTFPLCKRAISAAMHCAPYPVGLVGPTFPMVQKNCVETLEELLEGKRSLNGLKWDHKSSKKAFTISYGNTVGRIWYFSGEDPLKLKGSNLAAAYFDEPFIMERAVYDQMISRVRVGDLLELGLAGTPEQLNWGWELAEGDLGKKMDVGLVRASTSDNKTLPTEYDDALSATLDERAQAAYRRGEFVNLSAGQVFHTFNRKLHVKQLRRPEGSTLFAGMDFNVNPMSFVVGWALGERVHIFAEFELPNSDTEDAAMLVREVYPKLIDIMPDPTGFRRNTAARGRTDHNILDSHGFDINAPTGAWPLHDSINSVNGAFRHSKLSISPACKRLCRYLEAYTHELKNTTAQKAMSHLLDSLRYGVTWLLPVGGRPVIEEEIWV